ncbi:MAG: SPOR domain-containing protein [Desulfovibrionaceae bacterium]|nr:SPOR domain-containing protein [Desulfovibrionaceae bacterium]
MKFSLFLKPATYIVFWCISVVWIFFLGFSFGQNEAPQSTLPFLTSILPEQENSSSGVIPVTENELTYSTILQKSNTPIVVPNDMNVVEKDKKLNVQAPTPEVVHTNIIQHAELSREQKYKFSLQLLAVKQRKSAEEYRDKLQQENIPTEIVEASKNDVSWYRVYTTFTGTVSQFNSFKDRLTSLGIVDTILRERTPQ